MIQIDMQKEGGLSQFGYCVNNSSGDLPIAFRKEHPVPNCTLIPRQPQVFPKQLGPSLLLQ